jgi:low-density lipoprotein receptor
VCDSGELVTSSAECDGATDCGDGSDEARCPMFTCRDAAQQVPEAVVCDLARDCSDGSDEDMGCLRLTCQPRGDERIQP